MHARTLHSSSILYTDPQNFNIMPMTNANQPLLTNVS